MTDQNRSKILHKPPQHETALFFMAPSLTDVGEELIICQECHYHLLHDPANTRHLLSLCFAYFSNCILDAAVPNFCSLFLNFFFILSVHIEMLSTANWGVLDGAFSWPFWMIFNPKFCGDLKVPG